MAFEGYVVRDKKSRFSAGTFYLYKGDEIVGEWPCITGPETARDPEMYGGCTPNITWEMSERIKVRSPTEGMQGQQRPVLEMARIYPVYDEEKRLFPRRTFYGRDPFMVHVQGRSTGCICIPREHWRSFVTAINNALEENRKAMFNEEVGTMLIQVVEHTEEEESWEPEF